MLSAIPPVTEMFSTDFQTVWSTFMFMLLKHHSSAAFPLIYGVHTLKFRYVICRAWKIWSAAWL